MSDSFVMYSNGDWGAIYKNGELTYSGNTNYVSDSLLEYFGVDVRFGDEFLMGGNDYVAKNLPDIEEYKRSIEEEFKPSK